MRRHATWSAAALALAVIGIHCAVIRPWMPDDAFISFRYAESFASGNGIVFNPAERVEGYTSFLWVVLLALGHRLGCDTVVFSKLLSATFSVATVLLLAGAHRFMGSRDDRDAEARDRPGASGGLHGGISSLAVVMLGSCGVFTPWARSGMEVTLFTFLVLLSTLLYLSTRDASTSARDSEASRGALADTARPAGRREAWRLGWLGVVCAIAALTRPEGCLFFAVILTFEILRGAADAPTVRRIAYLMGPFVALYLPYFIWRYSYYGYLLPNTFFVKVGFHPRQVLRGLRYDMRFVAVAALILTPIVVWLFTRMFTRPFARKRSGMSFSSYAGTRVWLLVCLAGAYAAYVTAVGGDVLAAYRFFAPIMPLLCLASAICAGRLFRKRSLVPFVLTVFLYNLVQLNVGYGIHLHLLNDVVAMEGKEVGLWLRDHAPSDAVVAVNVAGSIPYYSRLRTIDTLGLNDVHIAHRQLPIGGGMPGHEKGDGAYVLSKEPAYIQFGASLGSKEPVFLGDREVAADPRFHDLYAMETHKLASGRTFIIYRRR